MDATISKTLTLTTFHISDPPDRGDPIPKHPWLAVATAHAYNANSRPQGLKTQEEAVLTGAAFEAVTVRVSGPAEEGVATSALKLLLERLESQSG